MCAQFTHLIEAILIFSTLWANSADEKSVIFCRPHMSKDTFSDVAALLYLACDGSCSYPRFLALIYIVSLSVMCRLSQQYVFLSFVLYFLSMPFSDQFVITAAVITLSVCVEAIKRSPAGVLWPPHKHLM